MGREEGGGFRMGNTGIPVADSFRYLAKLPRYIFIAATATAKSLQSCLTLCDPIDVSPPGSSVPGILQARTLSPMHESEK